MATCSIWKGSVRLGTGSITSGSTSVTGYSGVAPKTGRNVRLMITSSTDAGKVLPVRIAADGGSTLTLAKANPFAT